MKFIPRLVEEDEEEGIIVKPLDDTRTYSADAIADVFDREYDLSEDEMQYYINIKSMNYQYMG